MGGASGSEDEDDESGVAPEAAPVLVATLAGRLDRALAEPAAALGLSRSRLAALISAGALTRADGASVAAAAAKVKPGEAFRLSVPPVAPATPEPEAIALNVAHEDDWLIVVDKPAGMTVHPAPGAERGTLVAALLHHCGASLSGVGGVARPGIVHRIDKDTSGLLVVAKTDAAHAALAAQFAAHDLEREYRAVVFGAPDRADPRLAGHPSVAFEPGGVLRVDAPLGRSSADRKKTAVVAGGRRAVTRASVIERFGPPGRPAASLLSCRLETGRTHQIRVHLAHVGHPLVGDPLYGRARAGSPATAGFARQALHAAVLGFRHPADGRAVRFESPLPEDMDQLIQKLRQG
jgi:23S rRNA pseudouridine1911/1915/1917 synthase